MDCNYSAYHGNVWTIANCVSHQTLWRIFCVSQYFVYTRRSNCYRLPTIVYKLEGLAHFPARKKKETTQYKVFNEKETRAHLTKQPANLSSMLIVQPWAAGRGGMFADCCITCSLLSLFLAGECMWNNSDTLYRQDDVRRYILCPPLPSLQ